ncbi:putative tubulin polyglutamylase TTLL9 isoform X2 [Lycorma delicatula]|uniref:putative tubulin polyglutamylase TTLL9 isoform X2 n=1 Tax=Lycorma delicatula TaxID=130591 RepID=UPI003F5183B6
MIKLTKPKEKKTPRVRFYYFKVEASINQVITDAFKSRGWMQANDDSDNWDVYWCEVSQLRSVIDSRHRIGRNQYIPHFRNHYELTSKNQLARNMKRLKQTYHREGKLEDAKLCDCVPTTFEIPNEYHMFVEEYRKHPGSTWIVKPAVGCKGRGIFLFQKHKNLIEWRNQKCKDAEESGQDMETWVVQAYIEDPYLIAGRKFDLRIFVLVTSFFPLKAWMAREGFARFSGWQFSLAELENPMVHLTNMSLQLHASNSEKQGCKWSMRSVREFLTARHGAQKIEELMQKIGQVVVTSLCSVQSSIMQNNQCFELYGYDILLQANLKPWLIEVNASPSMNPTDSDDYNLKYNLIQDVLNIVDVEGRRTGFETRIGGFDMFWNGGPVHPPCPGFNKCGPRGDKNYLNIFLGCRNDDRREQLDELCQWKRIIDSKEDI